MRLRLFALLLVPTLTVFVLAASIVSVRNTEHKDAISAAETASLARRTALVDEALGVEALSGARAIVDGSARAEFMTATANTDAALAELRAEAIDCGDKELLVALAPVDAALRLRGDVEQGLVSPLQLLDRYTQLRRELLTLLADRVSLGAGSATAALRGLIAIIEARSEHLDERLELELVMSYQTWAPGLFGEVAASIGLQQDRLAEAASFDQGAVDALSPPVELQQYRNEILLEPTIPTFSTDAYQRVSDDWIAEMNSRIALEASRIEQELAGAESEARSQRNQTSLIVFLSLLVAVLIVGFVSYRLVHRLHIITDRARQFANGRLPRSGQTPVRGNDEISQLAGAFDEMVDQVQQRDLRLAMQACTDGLTGIGNRQHIIDFWAAAVAATGGDGRAVACLIDLDNFKPINDEFGHHVGDEVLQSMAGRLRSFVQHAAGGRAGRIGGDEFLVVLTDFDGDNDALLAMVRRLTSAISEPVDIQGSSFSLASSIGIARSRPGVQHLELLRDADEAMYAAKSCDGPEVTLSTPVLRAELLAGRQDRVAIVAALRAGEIAPWFQPIRTATGELAGFEALARWSRSDGTVRDPESFVDVLETEHMMPQLDAAIFEATCRQVVRWNEMGLVVDRVSVNFSAASIERSDFGERISGIIRTTGCPPSQLAVEVTESILMSDIETNAHRLQALRGLGFRIDIDDFGTGYSSLRYLRDLPIDSVKIDRVFIASIEQHPSSQAIVRSVVALAHDLNICVVAEGVETRDELRWLIANDAGKIQGFLLGLPARAEHATTVLHQHAALTTEMQAA